VVRRIHRYAHGDQRVARPVTDDPATPADPGPQQPPEHGSGNRAVDAAAERADATGADLRNVPNLAGLPVPDDTANLREGPDLHPALLGLLPLVGVWRGKGECDSPDFGSHHFGQQIVISHDGGDYLTWQARSWMLDSEGAYVKP